MNQKSKTPKGISLLLALLLVISSFSTAIAATGDIIHTGLKKIYTPTNATQRAELLSDIQQGAPVNQFYKDMGNNEYVNIAAQESAELNALTSFLSAKGATMTPDGIAQAIASLTAEENSQLSTALTDAVNALKKDFNEIRPDGTPLSEYVPAGSAPRALMLTTPNHYSLPTAGTISGSTKIPALTLPSGAIKWMVKIQNSPITQPELDSTLSGTSNYTVNTDIPLGADQFIILLATDSTNRIKAYANIPVTADQIKTPAVPATLITDGSLTQGSIKAGSCKVTGLPELSSISDATQWLVKIQDTPFPSSMEMDATLNGTTLYLPGEELVILAGDGLHPISSSLTKHMIVLAADDNGKIKGYQSFTITAASLAPAPNRLTVTTHYQEPTAGTEEGTTKISGLHPGNPPIAPMNTATKWRVQVQSAAFDVPALNSVIADTPNTTLINQSVVDNIAVSPGQHLLLTAVDNTDRVKGYRIFSSLMASQIKGVYAPQLQLDVNYSAPEFGSASSTTKIAMLKFDGLTGNPNTWRYKLSNEPMAPPAQDSVLTGTTTYTAGSNITLNAGQHLILLATDSLGKIKGYKIFEAGTVTIRPPSAVELQQTTHYTLPIKGDGVGTTKIETLTFGLSPAYPMTEATQWRFKIQDGSFEIPLLNSNLEGTQSYTAGSPINAAVGQRLIVLATNGSGNIKGYKSFTLTENQVRAGNAPELQTVNYSVPEPGTSGGTTKISTLNFTGITGATGWRYKVQNDAFAAPEAGTVVTGTTSYTQGGNIPISPGQNILLLAIDGTSKVKAYKIFNNIQSNQIRPAAVPQLIQTTHYTSPEPGSVEGSTKFSLLSFGSPAIAGATKWFVKIQSGAFEAPGLDTTLTGTVEYTTAGADILNGIEKLSPGQRLMLLATDNDGKIKAYKEFNLTASQIKAPTAPELSSTLPIINYQNAAGSLPGTTKFTNLTFFGLSGATAWRIKVQDEAFDAPALDSTLTGTSIYMEGQNVSILPGQRVILLATDGFSRVKGYKRFNSSDLTVTEHAPILTLNVNYKVSPGLSVDTTQLTDLSWGEGTKWQIITQSQSYPAPALDSILSNPTLSNYTAGSSIPVTAGQRVILFRTDNDNKIKAFADISILDSHIKNATAAITTNEIPEGSILTGGESIVVTLSSEGNPKWAADIRTNPSKRNALFEGLKTATEVAQWSKVVNALKADGQGAITRNSDTGITLHLPQTPGYDISIDQVVALTIPAGALEGGLSAVQTTGTLTVKPTIAATVTGTAATSIMKEADIHSGGKTIIVDLADGIWVGDVASNPAIRNALFEGLKPTVVGVGTDEAQWNKVVSQLKTAPQTSVIIRNTSTRITITLPSVADYHLNQGIQTIRLTIPPTAVEDTTGPIVASPTFAIMPNIVQVAASVTDGTVRMTAPDYKTIRTNDNSWVLTVNTGTLKPSITVADLTITGLPQGLTATAVKQETHKIVITLSGTATTGIGVDTVVKITIKGSAVTEAGALSSEEISLTLLKGTSILDNLKLVTVNVAGQKLVNTTNGMEYSTTSTNGVNGTWIDCASTDTTVDFIAGKVYVREKSQPTVYWEVTALTHSSAPNVAVEFTATPGIIKLAGATTAMEYSVNDNTTWEDVTPELANKTATLNVTDPTSDLRVRTKATADSLSSQPTTKLNGISLSGVNIDVASGRLTGTTIEIQYSLNSTNGSDGTWSNCTATNTNVTFVEGFLYVRDKTKIGNFKALGPIVREGIPDVNDLEYHIADATITVGSPATLEYRISGGAWTALSASTTTGGIPFQPGALEFRHKATTNGLASQPVLKATIPTPTAAPNLAFDDVDKTITKIDETETYQYKIGTGDWVPWALAQPSISFNNDVTVVSVRKVATEHTLPSQIRTISFTPNLQWTNIGIHVAAGQLTGTTTGMEYSLDSTNGTNGTWTACTNTATNVTFVASDIYIREKSKPRNYYLVATVIRNNQPLQEKINDITYHVANGTITIPKELKNTLQYRIGSVWKDLDASIAINDAEVMATSMIFQPGQLEFRTKATATALHSLPVSHTIPVEIGAIAAAPSLTYDDVTYIIPDLSSIFEYRINGGSWIPGTTISEFTGTDKVSIRKKATQTALAGLDQLISFTPNLNLYTVGINIATAQITNTTTGMEYSLNTTDGINGTWLVCTANNTNVPNLSGTVYIREKSKPRNNRKVTEHPIVAKSALTAEEINSIQYDIASTTLTVPAALANSLQFRIGTSSWTNLGTGTTTGGIPFQPGKLEFRKKADTENLASPPSEKVNILAPEVAPNLIVNDLANTIMGLDGAHEYKIGTGIWNSGDIPGDFSGNKIVSIRKKATQVTLPSLEQIINFTQNLNLSTVGVNIATNQITRTTIGMEYSINSSDGVNGTWTACSNTNTTVVFIPGKVFIREKAYPANKLEVTTIEMSTAGPSITAAFLYDVAYGTITVPEAFKNQLQYRFGDGNWTHLGADITTAGINFVPGKLYLRYKADATKLPSQATEWVTILAPAASSTLDVDDVQNIIVGLDNTYEYKVGTGPWTPGNVPGDFNGTKMVQVRKRATQIALPSLIQTINFTTNLDLNPVWVDAVGKKINGTTTAMEYSMNSTNGTDGDWSPCINATTHLPDTYVSEPVYVRAKTQTLNFKSVPTL